MLLIWVYCVTITPHPTGQQSRLSGGVSDESIKAYKDMNTFLAAFIDHVSIGHNLPYFGRAAWRPLPPNAKVCQAIFSTNNKLCTTETHTYKTTCYIPQPVRGHGCSSRIFLVASLVCLVLAFGRIVKCFYT